MISLAILVFFQFSFSTASNVLLYRGIAVRNDIFSLLCTGKGSFFIWRIDGNEIAIFNGRENVGHSIVNTFNATTVEFNATLLSASVDDSAIPVRTSNLDLNRRLYGNTRIQCETDLGGATIAPEVFTTENPTRSMSETPPPPPTEYLMSNSSCNDTELLLKLRGEGQINNCDIEDLNQFISDVLRNISLYAEESAMTALLLKNISRGFSNPSFTEDTLISSAIFLSPSTEWQLLLFICLGLIYLSLF